jgi:preprotein translocase SecE subunit
VGSAQRIVVFAYLIIGLVAAITVAKILGSLAFVLNAPNPGLLGNSLTVTDLVGIAVAAGAGYWAFKDARAHEYSMDVVNELRKVTWPSRKETQTATVVVIITTLVVAAILGLFDQVWGGLTGLLYKRA